MDWWHYAVQIWGAHAFSVQVIAFCDHELCLTQLARRFTHTRKVRECKMHSPARQSRALPIWSEANIKLIKEKFVPVAVLSGVQKRRDAEGEFIRDTCGLKFVGAGFHLVCVSPGGKVPDAV